MNHTKKCAIVTGGVSGFGRALTLFLVSKGIKVIVGDITVEQGELLEKEINKLNKLIVFCKCDVTQSSDLANLFEQANKHFGGAQIMVNNAGISRCENIEDSCDYFDQVVSVNYLAVIKGTALAIQHFDSQKKNNPNSKYDFCIINVSSITSIFPIKTIPVYSSTKSAINHFTHSLAYLKDKDIRVNAVAPGFARTEMTKKHRGTEEEFNRLVDSYGGFVSIDKVVNVMYNFIIDEKYFGDVVVASKDNERLLSKPTIEEIL